jgi:hypothetical protein
MRVTKRANSLANKTAGVGVLLCAFLATAATVHAGSKLDPRHLANSAIEGPIKAAVLLAILGLGRWLWGKLGKK